MTSNKFEEWASAYGTQQVALRCRIVLAAARGAIRQRHCPTVGHQSQNRKVMAHPLRSTGFAEYVGDCSGSGRKATYGPEKIQEILDTILRSQPRGETQWSCRSLSKCIRVRKSTVNNVWRSHNLKPHRVKTRKLFRALIFWRN